MATTMTTAIDTAMNMAIDTHTAENTVTFLAVTMHVARAMVTVTATDMPTDMEILVSTNKATTLFRGSYF